MFKQTHTHTRTRTRAAHEQTNKQTGSQVHRNIKKFQTQDETARKSYQMWPRQGFQPGSGVVVQQHPFAMETSSPLAYYGGWMPNYWIRYMLPSQFLCKSPPCTSFALQPITRARIWITNRAAKWQEGKRLQENIYLTLFFRDCINRT